MRPNPDYLLDDQERIRALIRENPWATLVSATSRNGLVGSHCPVLLEERAELSVVGHLGRPDDAEHELGEHEVLLIVDGPHGYVSPSWYGYAPAVPTYNYLAAHLYGRPEPLDAAATYRVLSDTVDRFEGVLPAPTRLDGDYARQVARGAAGFRLRPTRVVGKAKLSQDKPVEVVQRVIDALETDPHYHQPALAQAMRHELATRGGNGWTA